MEGIAAQTWSLLSAEDVLLAATGRGVVQVDSQGTHRLQERSAWSLLRRRARPGQVLVGLSDGLTTLIWEPFLQLWAPSPGVLAVPGTVRRMAEDADGSVWLTLWPSGVARLVFGSDADADEDPDVHNFPAERAGLPSGLTVVHRVAGRVVFGTRRGVLRFDPRGHRFVPFAPAWAPHAVGARDISTLAEDDTGNLWVSAGTAAQPEIGVAQRQPGGGYVYSSATTRGVPLAYSILPEGQGDGGVVWFGGPNGLVRLRGDPADADGVGFGALVRGVWRLDEDQPLFGGHPPNAPPGPWPAPPRLRLGPLHTSGLRFTFAAPCYDAPSETVYQTLLEGFDERWSTFGGQDSREYTNLPEGRYRFRVRARDAAGVPGREGSLRFEVLPPWYRSGWALLGYVQGGLLVVLLLAGWGTRRLRRGNQALRVTLRERTRKLREQQLELRRRAAKLQESAQENQRLRSGALPPRVAARLLKGEAFPADDFAHVAVAVARCAALRARSQPAQERAPGPAPAGDAGESLPTAPAVEREPPLGASCPDAPTLRGRAERLQSLLSEVAAAHDLVSLGLQGGSFRLAAGVPDAHPRPVAALLAGLRDLGARLHRTGLLDDPGAPALTAGLAYGPAGAGVVGKVPLRYDVWGPASEDAWTLAAQAPPGAALLSELAFARLGRQQPGERHELSGELVGDNDKQGWVVRL